MCFAEYGFYHLQPNKLGAQLTNINSCTFEWFVDKNMIQYLNKQRECRTRLLYTLHTVRGSYHSSYNMLLFDSHISGFKPVNNEPVGIISKHPIIKKTTKRMKAAKLIISIPSCISVWCALNLWEALTWSPKIIPYLFSKGYRSFS